MCSIQLYVNRVKKKNMDTYAYYTTIYYIDIYTWACGWILFTLERSRRIYSKVSYSEILEKGMQYEQVVLLYR